MASREVDRGATGVTRSGHRNRSGGVAARGSGPMCPKVRCRHRGLECPVLDHGPIPHLSDQECERGEADMSPSEFPTAAVVMGKRRRELVPHTHHALQQFRESVFAAGPWRRRTSNIAPLRSRTSPSVRIAPPHTRLARGGGASDGEIIVAIVVATETRAGSAYAHSTIGLHTSGTADEYHANCRRVRRGTSRRDARRRRDYSGLSRLGRRHGDVCILVDRLWPRGLKKEQVDFVEWVKDLAPSGELRRWYGHEPERFGEFPRRYRAVLSVRRERLQSHDSSRGSANIRSCFSPPRVTWNLLVP